MSRRKRRRGRGDDGMITLWLLGVTLIVMFVGWFSVTMWTGSSQRRQLAAAADQAAQAGATALDVDAFRQSGVRQLDPALAEQRALGSLAEQGIDDLLTGYRDRRHRRRRSSSCWRARSTSAAAHLRRRRRPDPGPRHRRRLPPRRRPMTRRITAACRHRRRCRCSRSACSDDDPSADPPTTRGDAVDLRHRPTRRHHDRRRPLPSTTTTPPPTTPPTTPADDHRRRSPTTTGRRSSRSSIATPVDALRSAGPLTDRRVLHAGHRLRRGLEAQLGDAIARGQHIEGQQPFTSSRSSRRSVGEPTPARQPADVVFIIAPNEPAAGPACRCRWQRRRRARR